MESGKLKVENEVIKQDFNQVYSIIDIHRKRAFQEINKIVPFETAQIPQFLLQINWTCHQQILNGCKTFKCDLLFYHRGLQCLVAIELKTVEFEPSFMEQLEFYLEALDQTEKRSNENPSIGILLCKEANREVVKYVLNRSMSPTMVAEYKEKLIPQEVLQRSLEEFIGAVGELKDEN